jgi:hypothetical protein
LNFPSAMSELPPPGRRRRRWTSASHRPAGRVPLAAPRACQTPEPISPRPATHEEVTRSLRERTRGSRRSRRHRDTGRDLPVHEPSEAPE